MKKLLWYFWVSLATLILLSLAVLSATNKQIPGSFISGKEISSPGNWIDEEQIKVYQNRVVLEIPNTLWAGFTNTNSMDPFLDEQANAIEIKPTDPDSIDVGDVISYKTAYGTIIHRVVEKSLDEEGVYYLVKGDNNVFQDPFKVRFADVQGVVVAVIY